MCGLVGIISKWNSGVFSRDVDMFKNMMFLDTLRGDDGTGVCIVNTEQGATVLKKSTDYPAYQYEKAYIDELKLSISEGKALLGHNRKATVGSHKDENAHPFVYEDRYVFFHNGTLTNHKQFGNTEVDSEAFGSAITACEGDIEKLNEVFSKAQGAWACVWYDSLKHTIYLTRNKERPLNFLFLENGNIMYASETWMGQVAATRNAEKVKESKGLEEWVLYSIDLSTAGVLNIKEEKLTKKVAPVQVIIPGSHRKHTNTGDTKILSKADARQIISEHVRVGWVGFYVTDVQCQDASVSKIDEAFPQTAYDWIIFGTSPDYPGVLYSGILKDAYKYEVNKLISEKGYVHGYYTDAEYTKGKVDVWMDEVYNTVSYVC